MSDTRKFETIKVEVDDAVGRLTLNRPERLNAIGATYAQGTGRGRALVRYPP